MKSTRKRSFAVAAIMAMALVAGACSGSDDDTSADSTNADASTTVGGGGDTTAAVATDSAVEVSTADSDGTSVLNDIVERGELRVGMTLQFEPEMYLDEYRRARRLRRGTDEAARGGPRGRAEDREPGIRRAHPRTALRQMGPDLGRPRAATAPSAPDVLLRLLRARTTRCWSPRWTPTRPPPSARSTPPA